MLRRVRFGLAGLAFVLILSFAEMSRAVPPPTPLSKLVPKAEWIVIGTLGRLRPAYGPDRTSWMRHGDIEIERVLKSPSGGKRPKTLTLETLDPKSGRIGPIMYREGSDGVWLLQPAAEKGVYIAPDSNSNLPRERWAEVDRLLPITRNLNPVHKDGSSVTRTLVRGKVVVAQDGTGDTTTIGSAIERAASGAQIQVRPGLYHESIVLNKPLLIAGEGPRNRIIIQTMESDGVFVETNGTVIVRGLTIRCWASPKAKKYAIDIAGGTARVEDCDLSSRSLACIGIHGNTTKASVSRCWVHHAHDAGVYFYDAAHGTIEDSEIFRNHSSNVAVEESSDVTIRRCRIHDGDAEGITVDRSRLKLEQCEIYQNAAEAVFRTRKATVRMRDCRIDRQPLRVDTVTTNVDGDDQRVPPQLNEIIIHFPESMDRHSWYVTEAPDVSEQGRFPELAGEHPIAFRDDKTLVIHVQLAPGTRYALALNDAKHLEFQTVDGRPLEPMILWFHTAGGESIRPDKKHRRPSATQIAAAVVAIEKLGGHVRVSTDQPHQPVTKVVLELSTVTDNDLALLKPLVDLTSLDLTDAKITDAGLAQLEHLTKLEWLGLSGTQVTDAGLKHLANMPTLWALHLNRTQVTGSGFAALPHLDKLRMLSLCDAPVTDQAMPLIARYKRMEHLLLSKTRITDAGLEALAKLEHLITLNVRDTEVTESAIDRLRHGKILHVLY